MKRNYKGIPDNTVLASIFKNMPMKVWRNIEKYKTKGKRDYRLTVHGREGKTTSSGFSAFKDVALKDAKSVDVYVRETEHHYNSKQHDMLYELREEIRGHQEDKELMMHDYDKLHEINDNLVKANDRMHNILLVLERREGDRRKS
ncbi:MAG TPA: hypothetical protein EYQ21_05090 [Flavobacteriales bacterium]|nr:hypothetical protein [Flavobacteriales bacterium]